MESEASKSIAEGVHMGIEKLISIAAVLAMIAASTGRPPQIIQLIRVAQLQLLEESQASN
jgi:hypothetical protein